MTTNAPSRARRPVLVAYGALTALGALFFAGSFAYPWTQPEDGTIGAGVMPRTAGLLLTVLGLLLVRQELRTGSVLEGDGHVEEAAADGGAEEARRVRTKLIVVVVTMVVTALLVPFLGLLPALTLMTLFLTAVVERQPLARSVLVAALVFALSYLLFITVLSIPLPFGLFDPAVWSQL
ncbi:MULTISPECIES: tripartite tricarboxylate transporter TctB family protein [unclassified Streptomyces]|uniref:tripartite tricarboxylate transporter TctB family protein n=1 Tax=unclassified Streptomyces TaxID=2593676 RepID=UPI00278C62DB|nr:MULTISPECIES: tripartite tricarboxylate transporter TctB family protein [unclassified Streptomyces]